MNSNFIRTILNVLTGGALTSIMTTIVGCKTPVVGAAFCDAAWIPIEYQTIAGMAFVALGFLLKMFGGSGATVAQNITAPVVPIVPAKVAGPGTVTETQVASK